MATHIEHVQRTYAESEMLDFGKDQARLLSEISQLEDQKKQANDHFKSEMSARETLVAELSKKINLGYEIVPTPCDVILNSPTPGMKSYVCQKSMRTVKVVPMTDDDKQLGLYGN